MVSAILFVIIVVQAFILADLLKSNARICLELGNLKADLKTMAEKYIDDGK